MSCIYDKYKILHIDGCRHYEIDLKVKEYSFENTVPYCLTIYGVDIYESSWKGMIEKTTIHLDEINPKPVQELLAIKNSWGKQSVFSEVKKTNYVPFKGIYINANHTAVHAMWTIQLLLQEYSIDLDKCKFIIRRLPISEPKEVREYERMRAEQGFKQFLLEKYNKSENFINGLVKNVDLLNKKILPKLTVGYFDLFLIESPLNYANYSSKIIEYAKDKMLYNEGQLKTIEYTLNKLGKYIKLKNKENKINYGFDNLINDSETLEDFPEDF